jgi:hypothetical protein
MMRADVSRGASMDVLLEGQPRQKGMMAETAAKLKCRFAKIAIPLRYGERNAKMALTGRNLALW